jgi:Ca-activated chloride channel family protein
LITLHADRSLVRSDSRSTRHLELRLRAPEAPARQARLPVNLAFVIDRSGSMHGSKIEYARKAVAHGIRSLREGDRFAVVSYDDQIELVAGPVEATWAERERAVAAVERIQPRAHTNLHGGWQKGCEQVAEQLSRDAVGRCLLLTDGLANTGITDPEEIVRQAASWRDRRVVTTALGVGVDFDETLLRRMADAGGGSFRFIADAVQIGDFMASEVGEALATTVREAVLVVEAGDGSVVESLNDFPCRREPGAFRVALGSLYSGQTLVAALRVTLPEGPLGQTRDVVVRVGDLDNVLGGPTLTARFTWAGEQENERQPLNLEVARRVASLYAARAERDALEANRVRDYEGAREALREGFERIRELGGDDPEIAAILVDIRGKARWYTQQLDPLASKTFHSISVGTLSGRFRAVSDPPSGSQHMYVVSGWEVQAAVARVLEKVAAASPGLLQGVDIPSLAQALAHEEKRSCLFDPSPKADGDVTLSLEAADLCAQCRARLEEAVRDRDRLARLVEALRLLGAPSGVVH